VKKDDENERKKKIKRIIEKTKMKLHIPKNDSESCPICCEDFPIGKGKCIPLYIIYILES
jgi:hypothetical protein